MKPAKKFREWATGRHSLATETKYNPEVNRQQTAYCKHCRGKLSFTFDGLGRMLEGCENARCPANRSHLTIPIRG